VVESQSSSVEAVLRLARLQIEEAQNERAGEAEQRGRERDAHAAKRRGESPAQRFEQRAGIPARLQVLDDVADRAHGLDQAPEGSQQAEEDEQPGHVARDVARLVEPGGDRVEDAAHQVRRHRHAAHAAAKDGGHRRQQHRRPVDRKAGIGKAEIVDPGDLRVKADHLAERQHDADRQHRQDQRIQARVGHKGDRDLLVEHKADQPAQDDEDQHPEQEDARRGQFERVEFFCHTFDFNSRRPRNPAAL
jgi:hypothetical protein